MRLDQFNKSSSLKKSQPTIFTHPSPSSKLPSMSWSNITQSFFFTGDVNVPTSHDQPRGCKMVGLLQYVHVYWICPGPVLFSRKKKPATFLKPLWTWLMQQCGWGVHGMDHARTYVTWVAVPSCLIIVDSDRCERQVDFVGTCPIHNPCALSLQRIFSVIRRAARWHRHLFWHSLQNRYHTSLNQGVAREHARGFYCVKT